MDPKKEFSRAYVRNGVVRWDTNEAVPFDDMLALFENAGLIDRATRDRSNAARQADNAKFVAEYRKRPRRALSAEARYEMRAAFGPGETVVDVISGRKYRT